MNENCKEQVTPFLGLADKMHYFTKLKPGNRNNKALKTDLEITSYCELNQTISSILRTSISILKNETSKLEIDVMFLLEIALKLLPDDEMELLDELYKIAMK
jgi:hypothetical protein